ncbi:hypothetical protein [Zooshikella ganghwensis]|uniref:hypothetical protein n=1 Tax=Zooshikella ganghwensis TaxID=202772 RepID=UPI000420521D|nr:hypothetical protein [Zooshikella ganghwensis]
MTKSHEPILIGDWDNELYTTSTNSNSTQLPPIKKITADLSQEGEAEIAPNLLIYFSI